MYQVLVFILLLLAQVSHGKTNPLAGEEPLYTGSNSSTGSTAGQGISSIAGSATGTSTSSTASTTTTTGSTTASTDCKMDENVLLCLCETKFSGQKELCITAAGQDNVLYAYKAALGASRAANPQSGSASAAAPMGGIDPALLSLFSNQQQSSGMDPMQMMMLMQMLTPQSGGGQDQSQMYGQDMTAQGGFAEGQ